MPVNMARRKEVFQSKVLQKLYPATPKLEKEPSSPCLVDALANNKYKKRKASHTHSNAEMTHSAMKSRRMYTALPPPADYNADSGTSVTLPQPENINSVEAPSEHNLQEFGEELEQDLGTDEPKRRRKKRKKRQNLEGDLRNDGMAPNKDIGQNGMPADEEAVRVSRNKRRKLKKKRHKEKLLSMGLMPRASALEFTYQKQQEEKDEENDDVTRVAGGRFSQDHDENL